MTGGQLGVYRDLLAAEIRARPSPIALAGHSMGAASRCSPKAGTSLKREALTSL
jgi:hypothetical protein